MKSVTIDTTARLALCLIDMNGEKGRVDGCVGFSIKKPNLSLTAALMKEQPSTYLQIENVNLQEQQIIKNVVERYVDLKVIRNGLKVKINSLFSSHQGLGMGTQLRLSIAAAICTLNNVKFDNVSLANQVARGGTSGIGVWSFAKGGFIIDGGHSFGEGLDKNSFIPSSKSVCKPPPLLFQKDFPDEWKILCFEPCSHQKIFGETEYRLFRDNCPVSRLEVNELSAIVLMTMLPALVEKNLANFNFSIEAMQMIGFKSVVWKAQPQIVKNVKELITSEGLSGVGLSSLGNTMFLVVNSKDQIDIQNKLNSLFEKKQINCSIWATSGNNQGAKVLVEN